MNSEIIRAIKFPWHIWICISAAVIIFFYLYFPTLLEIAHICWTNDDYSHGLILPFISFYVIWTNKSEWLSKIKLQSKLPHGINLFGVSVLGLLTLSAGSFIYVIGSIVDILFIKWLSFFLTLSGMLFLVLRRSLVYYLLPPILLVYMAKPLPDSLIPKLFFPLQVLAARAAAAVLRVADVPVYLRGNIIEIPGMQLLVEEACSGLRSLMALLTVAMIVLLSIQMPLVGKIALLGMSVVVAISLNIVRVTATGLLSHFYDPSAASGFFHTFSGLVVFFIGLVILYYFGILMNKICNWNR